MRKKIDVLLFILVCSLWSCDSTRIYDQNHDFEDRHWLSSEEPVFEFEVTDTSTGYDLFTSVRNESDYPNANLYYEYVLTDSLDNVLEKKLLSHFLFDQKSGKPFGSTVLGDIFDHQFLILENYRFEKPGRYSLKYTHKMRTDTLEGILAVGLRVSRHTTD
ncbi:MAG TPA: gliding motility lipoprotein GldH [Cyclobacteriaceae bacterium]|jgi:gliding motility-associated lipoprotein GldH